METFASTLVSPIPPLREHPPTHPLVRLPPAVQREAFVLCCRPLAEGHAHLRPCTERVHVVCEVTNEHQPFQPTPS